jgi:hypothetical protein
MAVAAVPGSEDVVVVGFTNSGDFPVTAGAFDTTHDPLGTIQGRDGFVARLSSDGASLVYSTYLGGSEEDHPECVVAAADGAVFVSGHTAALNFPVTPGAWDTTYNGDNSPGPAFFGDVFVTQLSPDGSGLVFSTYFGGADSEKPTGIALTSDGETTIAGYTDSTSTTFPLTPGAYDTVFLNSAYDSGFIAQFSADGSSLNFSTLFAGDELNSCRITGLALGAGDEPTVVGHTESVTLPTTPGAFQETLVAFDGVFLSQFAPDGTALLYSTFFDGSVVEWEADFIIEPDGAAVVYGRTNSSDLPLAGCPFDSSFSAPVTLLSDLFVARIRMNGAGPSDLEFCSYLGAAESETLDGPGTMLARVPNGQIVVTGRTSSPDFPVPNGAFSVFPGFGGFVVSLDLSCPPFRRGNVNGDMSANIADAVAMLGDLFAGTSVIQCEDAADVNDDGGVNIADPVYLLSWAFSGGPEPAAPFVACGQDQIQDSLECGSGAPCP